MTDQSARRRFVIVQIDGLAFPVLERALKAGTMPALARLLRHEGFRLYRMPVGLPTSTPAFQAALMYGGPVDIPAFEFLDKRTKVYHWFPQPWTSAHVEDIHANEGCGIMRGGRTYGCVFTGGAADCVMTFAHLLRPSRGWWTLAPRHMLASLVLVPRVSAKLVVTMLAEALGGAKRTPLPLPFKKRLLIRWLRELSTAGMRMDVRAGLPALYVDFVGYDEVAHPLGPTHPATFRELRRIDRSIRAIWRAVRRVPQFRYDVFVLSDHGQTPSVPFEEASGGESAADALLGAFGVKPDSDPPKSRTGIWAGDLCFVPAGPNVNVYLTQRPGHVPEAELDALYPGVLGRLSAHPAIGLVLVRGREGLVCYYRGTPYRTPLPDGPTGCPLFDRPDRELVLRSVSDLLAMPSSGDLVVYGHYTGKGCVSFLGERGSHAGPSEEEMYGFVLAPARLSFDFSQVSGPRDLYPLFAEYLTDAPEQERAAARNG
jgi:hypothetical protein